MSEAFIGEVRYFGFNFPPQGWALCDGSLLRIAEHTPLFALLGTLYGGDGRSTFALPDLRGSFALGAGEGAGLPQRTVAGRTAMQSSSEPAPDRTIGTLALNPCICVEGLWPERD